MSVVAQNDVTRHKWQGFVDRRFPIGAWHATDDVVGDASGGQRTIDLFLQQSTAPTGLTYSVERLMVTDSDNNSKSGLVVSGGFLVGNSIGFRMEATDTLASLRADLWRRMFLGVTLANVATGGLASLSFVVDNVDLAILIVTAEGYIWDQRSSQADGGYQVPLTSPWSSA